MFRKIARQIPAVILYTIVFILLTTFFFSLAFKQTAMQPYETTEALEGTGVYAELQDILPEALQQSEELNDVTSDEELNAVFGEVMEEELTIGRIKEMVHFIEKDIWDYILERDRQLEPLDIRDIRTVLLEQINDNENMGNRIIYTDKFVEEIEWSSIMSVKTKTLDRLASYYERITSLTIISGMVVLILVGLSFLLLEKRRHAIRWLAGACVVTGIALLVSVILFHIIGIDWMDTNLEITGTFASLSDNVEVAIDKLYIAFLTALLGCSGIVTMSGIGLFSLSYVRPKPVQKKTSRAA
ncbi:hypothetical protein ACSVDE_15860 [Pseudalkalibacillus sp. Hm43]|uniref:hypothetical protein n=1 Tax=Pseudalkalibacillus sp. Hm43 TaxID=3450742 RepID=UPI003F435674